MGSPTESGGVISGTATGNGNSFCSKHKTGISREPVTELYNLEKDPSEQSNVAAQNPGVVSELIKTIDTAHTLSEHKNFRLASEKPKGSTKPDQKDRKE